jgi:hypothetical protein
MSNTLAIATVTATLQTLIQNEIAQEFPGGIVTIGSPAQSSDTATPQVNIFLYQVTPNIAFRNSDLPSRNAQGQLIQRLQTGLNLYYLISFYGNEQKIVPQCLLGHVVRILDANPIMTPTQILNTINNPVFSYLNDSDLANQTEAVKFSLMDYSLEELSKLWSIFPQFDYVLSVSYQASVVLIDGVQIPSPVEPVQPGGVQIQLNPFGSGPLDAASSLQLFNILLFNNQLSAQVLIGKAYQETDINDYILYWSADGISPLPGQAPLAEFPPQGTDIYYTLTNANIPTNAGYLLVLTSNNQGQMTYGPSASFTINTLPQQTARQITFTDQDPHGTLIGGPATIYRVADESTIDIYNLYWGSSLTTKLAGQTAIVALPKTGSNLTYLFPMGTPLPIGATYLLVFTSNTQGEMPIGVGVKIVDLMTMPPIHAAGAISFTGTIISNGEQRQLMSAQVTITKASDERDVSDYVLYWGSNATTILPGDHSEIGLLPPTGQNLTYPFANGTLIPNGANYILVFTSNYYGQMTTGVSCALPKSPTN